MTAQKDKNIPILLNPESVAVTGVSVDPDVLGSYLFRNIILNGYEGKLFPISSDSDDFSGYKAYYTLRDINDPIDLIVISSPSDRVVDDVSDCIKADVKNVCIFSNGFAETGSNGLVLQKKIKRILNEAGINLVGPNSSGLVIPSRSLNVSLSQELPSQGKVAFLSQSSALINAFIEYSKFYSLGVSEILGLGNKSDIDEIDLINYYASVRDDGRPDVIGCYLESISHGRNFLEQVPELTAEKPVVVLAPSESPKTREFIYNHTGSVLQDDDVLDLALAEANVLKVYTQQQLYDVMLGFGKQPVPRGNKVAVISNSGGGLILSVEQMYRRGLKAVDFSSEARRMLIDELDWNGKKAGIVDLGKDALAIKYLKAIDIVLGDTETDSVIAILSPQIMTQLEDTAESIGRLAKNHGKTVLAAFMGYRHVEDGIVTLSKYGIPAYNSVDRAIFTLAKMYQYTRYSRKESKLSKAGLSYGSKDRERPESVLQILEQARVERRPTLEIDEAKTILDSYDFQMNGHDKDTKIKEMDSNFQKSILLTIRKDTYYQYMKYGWNLKEVSEKSFGHILILNLEGEGFISAFKTLLPLDNKDLDHFFRKSKIIEHFGYSSGSMFEKVKTNLIRSLSSLADLMLDFNQILEVEIKGILADSSFKVIKPAFKIDLLEN